MIKDRKSEIHAKGFNLAKGGVVRSEDETYEYDPVDFSKVRVGLRTLTDATLDLGTYRKVSPELGSKTTVLRAIYDHDYDTLRKISEYFYESSGIYQRLCRHLATLYRYDWVVTPLIIDEKGENKNKELKEFATVLTYLDKSEVKRAAEEIALEVMKSGAFYGLILDQGDFCTF